MLNYKSIQSPSVKVSMTVRKLSVSPVVFLVPKCNWQQAETSFIWGFFQACVQLTYSLNFDLSSKDTIFGWIKLLYKFPMYPQQKRLFLSFSFFLSLQIEEGSSVPLFKTGDKMLFLSSFLKDNFTFVFPHFLKQGQAQTLASVCCSLSLFDFCFAPTSHSCSHV